MSKATTSLKFSRTQGSARKSPERDDSWVPNTDVYTTDDKLVIKLEIAGMRRDDLELTVEGQFLKVRGFRPDECRESSRCFQVMEINYGFFESVIEVAPGFDVGKAAAAYQNGFLRIEVPAKGKEKGRKKPRIHPAPPAG